MNKIGKMGIALLVVITCAGLAACNSGNKHDDNHRGSDYDPSVKSDAARGDTITPMRNMADSIQSRTDSGTQKRP